MQEVLLLKIYIFLNNSAGGISRVSTTTNRVALENSNAQSQLGSSIASVFGSLTLTQGDFTKDILVVYLMLILKLVLKEQ
jgi:hypothetical protein